MSNIFYVYEHWRPDTGACFYVGKGKSKRAHKMSGRSDFHQKIINKLLRMGMCVEVKIFASGLTEEEAFQIEISRISHWRKLGIQLANRTNGGDGVSGLKMSDEAKEKMRDAKLGKPGKSGTSGMKFSDETRAKMSAAAKGKSKSSEHAKKVGLKHRGKIVSPETRAKMSAAKKGKKLSSDHAKNTSVAIKAWWDRRKQSQGENL